MHRPNRSTPTPGGSPMPHLQRGPTRALSIGGHSTTPSYPDLCSVRPGRAMSSTLRFLPVALALLLIASPAPAQVVIYLDFDKHEDLTYPDGSSMLAVSVPAFTGNAAARARIQAVIEEDYAPFNVIVTQVEPAGIDQGYNGQIRVAIGGCSEAGARGCPPRRSCGTLCGPRSSPATGHGGPITRSPTRPRTNSRTRSGRWRRACRTAPSATSLSTTTPVPTPRTRSQTSSTT